ncbi:zinc-ribbon domain-containing protein [Dictyobacter arantiisoli]|uniref:Zinc-ribbon domain-containing protein n=1 Tax=Dictyobacter arantiisoli TaxID=2014874 RepID=A0A5A5TFK8_9CHLR|nr:zinc-ribbon domain-containing protein [Dictyobacter arantiisoli]GCF10202.1 hypothetical protein KDI_37660 [Dictyobacter arantiisoli]
MKCSQCSTELRENTAFCPRCGTRTQTSQISTFSYLPPGAPPWPTAPPVTRPSIIEANTVDPPGNGPLKTRQRDSKARKAGRGWIATIAVLVLAPVLGVLIALATLYSNGQLTNTPARAVNTNTTRAQTRATPKPSQSQNTLPIPTSFKTAKDPTINVSLQYPADWTAGAPQKSTTSTSMAFTSQNQIGIQVYLTHFASSVTSSIPDTATLNQAHMQNLNQQGFQNIQTVQTSNAQPSIGGEKWSQNEATVLDTNNNKYHFTIISVNHKKSYYSIAVFMPDDIYREATQKYLQPMFNSFKFLS